MSGVMDAFSGAKAGQSFTLIELMIACTIVSILTLVAIPICSGYKTSAIICEGVAGAGTIRTALAVYRAQNGGYVGATITNLLGPADLEGKYFAQSDYKLTNVDISTYLITAGPPSRTSCPNMPYYSIDQDGSEHGTWYSGQ